MPHFMVFSIQMCQNVSNFPVQCTFHVIYIDWQYQVLQIPSSALTLLLIIGQQDRKGIVSLPYLWH